MFEATIKYVEGTTIVLDVGGKEKRVVANKRAKVEGIDDKPNATIADLSNYDTVEIYGSDAEITKIVVLERVSHEESLEISKHLQDNGSLPDRPTLTSEEVNDAAFKQEVAEDTED